MSEQEDDDDALRILGILESSTDAVSIYGLQAPAWFLTTLYRRDKPISVNIYVVVNPEHGPLPQGIQVNAGPGKNVTYKDGLDLLKGQPVDQLLHQALLFAARAFEWDKGLESMGKLDERRKPIGPLSKGDQEKLAARLQHVDALIREVPKPIKRRSVTRKLLEEVTTVYRQAVEDGHPPTKAVAEHFKSTHASAARWVREARKVGMLGPSLGTTGGEAPTSTE